MNLTMIVTLKTLGLENVIAELSRTTHGKELLSTDVIFYNNEFHEITDKGIVPEPCYVLKEYERVE